MSTLTVIIPTRNMAATLPRAIESASAADEIIVIDDASDDDTEAVVRMYGDVKYVRHKEKSKDHNIAQRDYWMAVESDQIVGLGADDWLYPGTVEALKSCARSPVVFTDMDTFDESGLFLGAMFHHFYGNKTAREIREKFKSRRISVESGVATAVRSDIARWLWGAGWDRLGPMMDSVGMSTAACLFGAAYLSVKGAGFTIHERGSYGMNPNRTAEEYYKLGCTSVAWMFSVGLDSETIKAIAHFRCCINDYFLHTL